MKPLYLITGANGHLGSTIIRCLRQVDCHIRGLILPAEECEDDRQVTYYKGDVTRPATLEGIFSGMEGSEVTVIHTAGIISIDKAAAPLLYEVNVTGTCNIIAQCIRHRVKRLVYVSSVHALPEGRKGEAVTESAAFCADSVTGAYAKSKAEATQAVLDAAQCGLDAVVVHPSGIIGPYDDGKNHMVQFIGLCASGRLPAGVRGGFDFVDVRDVAEGCLLAAAKGSAGSCYILGNRYFTIAEIMEYVRGICGGAKKVCLPVWLVRSCVPILERAAKRRHIRPLFTRYAIDTIAGEVHFSHAKAGIELGYSPRDMQITVRDTIFWLTGRGVPGEVI